jgi:hypothetical protein
VGNVALISISGVALPTPTEVSFGVYDISKAERNANGTMLIERITTKKKISCTYSFVTREQLSTILKLVEPVFWNVTYIDPVTNTTVTGSFYCGDRNLGMVDFIDGVPRYKDLSFELIER